MTSNRRTFVINSVVGASALTAALSAQAQAVLAESDPQAVALGYKADATKADKTKYPKYAAGQACHSCALFQGKATDAKGGCPLFAGKQVSSKGWCSAWSKKA
ncbi:MAG: high-potential iron-sulfur protein [Rhodoferax sp.]